METPGVSFVIECLVCHKVVCATVASDFSTKELARMQAWWKASGVEHSTVLKQLPAYTEPPSDDFWCTCPFLDQA